MKKIAALTITLALTVASLTIPLHAADRTWSGGAADALWSTASNWGGTAPGDELTLPFTAVLGTYGTFTGAFTGWRSVNTGLPDNVAVATKITAQNGVVSLHMTYGGLLILLR